MTYILIPIAIAVLWYAMRKVNLWYWKVDVRIHEQRETNRLLRKMAGEPEPTDNSQPTEPEPQLTDEQRAEAYNKRLYGGG